MPGWIRMWRRWSRDETHRIVAKTQVPEVSPSQVARRYGLNTNLRQSIGSLQRALFFADAIASLALDAVFVTRPR